METLRTQPDTGRKLPTHTEVAIVGGGLTGVLTAVELARRGIDSVVIERGRVGCGNTSRTPGILAYGEGLFFSDILRSHGAGAARILCDAEKQAVENCAALAESAGGASLFREMPCILYDREDGDALEEEAHAARLAGVPAELRRSTELPFPVALALSFPGCGAVVPAALARLFSEKVRVITDTTVTDLHEKELTTASGERMFFDSLVLACPVPLASAVGLCFSRLTLSRTFCAAYSGIPPLGGAYIDIGGGTTRHTVAGLTLLTAHTARASAKNGRYGHDCLSALAERDYPGARERSFWFSDTATSPDGLPLIGRLAPYRPNWYAAAATGRRNLTWSLVAGSMLARMIAGEKCEAEDLLSPTRFGQNVPRTLTLVPKKAGVPKLRIAAECAEELFPGCAEILSPATDPLPAYRDTDGILHTVSRYNQHRSCGMVFSRDTLTWYCPRHGVTFSQDGFPLTNAGTRA